MNTTLCLRIKSPQVRVKGRADSEERIGFSAKLLPSLLGFGYPLCYNPAP
jgi:hypothetical protein